MRQNLKATLFLFLSMGIGIFPAQSASNSSAVSPLYFLATEDQVKLLDQKLEYHVIDKNSVQIGNLIISTNNLKLTLDAKENIIAVGPQQLMVGGTLIIKDPLGKALWSRTIDSAAELQEDVIKDLQPNKKNDETGKFILDTIEDFNDRLKSNSIFSFCIFNETKNNRIQICTPTYALNYNNRKWALRNPETSKKENTVIVNGVEVNEHGIIQFDKSVQSVAIAINLKSGLFVEIKAVPIDLDILDLSYDETLDEAQLKLREKNPEKKNALPWIAKVPLKNPFLYIEAYGQLPLKQELRINKDLIPKSKERPTLEYNISKTYSSSVTLNFKSQPNLKMKPATKGDRTKKTSSKIEWQLNNIKTGISKPHFIDIEWNKIKFIGAYEVERVPSWVASLEGGSGSAASKITTVATSSPLSSSDSDTLLQFNVGKYFDSFFGLYSPSMHLRWSLHLQGNQRSYSKSKSSTTDVEADLSYRLNENFHHTESSSSLRLSALSRGLKTNSGLGDLSSMWLGIKWMHDGPHNFQNKLWTYLVGNSHEFQLAYFGVCMSKDCKQTTLMNTYWQSRYDLKDNYFWSWKIQVENMNAKTDLATQSSMQYEMILGLGTYF